MSDADVATLVQQLHRAQERLLAQLDGATPGELYTAPAEGEWSAMEILAHVIEVLPTWALKAQRIAHEDDVLIERTPQEQEQRLAVIAAHGRDDLDTARRRLQEATATAIEILQGLRPQDLDRTGRRNDGTVLTARDVITRFLTQHLDDHAEQIALARQAAR